MEAALALLPAIACPVGMGLVMWLTMRGRPVRDPGATAPVAATATAERPWRTFRRGGLCLDRRVVIGLAAIGLAVALLAPEVFWVAVPLLLLTACPLSMLLMMGGMTGNHCAAHSTPAGQSMSAHEERLADPRAQQTAITDEMAPLDAARMTALRETHVALRTIDAPVSPVAGTVRAGGADGRDRAG